MRSEEFHSYHHKSDAVKLIEKRLQDNSIDEKEAQLINKFLTEKESCSASFSGSRHVMYASIITKLRMLDYLTVPWYIIDRDTYLKLVSDIKTSPRRELVNGKVVYLDKVYAQNTSSGILKAMVCWLSWLSERGEISLTKEEIRAVKIKGYTPKAITRENIYSEKMVAELLQHANTMERAMFWTAYETGARPSEVCDIRWGDITWKDKSAVVLIRDTKCNQRRTAYITMASIAPLREWRNMYPGLAEGEAPAFVMSNGEKVKYGYYITRLRRLQFNPDGSRRMPHLTPHMLRNSRVTNLHVQGVSRSTICMQHWGTTNTNMDSVYSKFADSDAIAEFDSLYGISEKSEAQKPLGPNYCSFCGTLNTPSARYCSGCGRSLTESAEVDLNSVIESVQKSNKYMQIQIETLEETVRELKAGKK